MRFWLLLLWAPIVGGAVLEDPAGDLQVMAANQGATTPTNGMDVDLARLEVVEGEDFEFLLVLHPAPPGTVQEGGARAMGFQFGSQCYLVEADHAERPGARLSSVDAISGQPTFVADLEAHLVDDRTLSVTVPRILILDLDGQSPISGDVLHSFWVESSALVYGRLWTPGYPTHGWRQALLDRMPDEETGGEFDVLLGRDESGFARLFSTAPSRTSNGESSTIVYPLTAKNEGPETRSYRLSIEDQPGPWTIDLPTAPFILEPGQARDLYAIVAIPFAHRHGAVDTAHIVMTDEQDPTSRSVQEIRIVYHSVPQPAGHHDTLWFHTDPLNNPGDPLVAELANGWMNTIEENPDSVDRAFQGTPDSTAGSTQHRWWFDLRPSLTMGLNFHAGEGLFSAPLRSPIPIMDGHLNATLYLRDGAFVALGTAEAEGIEFPAGETVRVEAPFLPLLDELPFDGARAIILEVRLSTGRPLLWTGPDQAVIEPGGFLQLPLAEYRDPLPEAASQARWRLDDSAVRVASPGSIVLFEPQIAATTVDLTSNTPWARMLPSIDDVHPVVVDVPSSAAPGDVVDIILQADAETGPALLRLMVQVEHAPFIDDSPRLLRYEGAPHNDSPGAPLLLALLLALVVRKGRRISPWTSRAA